MKSLEKDNEKLRSQPKALSLELFKEKIQKYEEIFSGFKKSGLKVQLLASDQKNMEVSDDPKIKLLQEQRQPLGRVYNSSSPPTCRDLFAASRRS